MDRLLAAVLGKKSILLSLTVRGAVGGAILTAELMKARGVI